MARKKSVSFPSASRRPVIFLALKWYAPAIHRGVVRYASQAGWILDIRMLRSGNIPSAWMADGIICTLQMDAMIDDMAEKAKVPVVNIGNLLHPRIPRVSSDNVAVGQLAADYFLQRGFRNYAFFKRELNSPGEIIRMESFRKRIEAAGPAHSLRCLDWAKASRALHQRDAEPQLNTWLARELSLLEKPLAVFAEFDDPAIEILQACVTGKLAVPEQVAVLGVDDDPLRCEFAPVPLSSVDDDQEMIGYEAAALLDRMMKGASAPSAPILVPPKGVTTRQSTDILAVDHPMVAMALRFIWAHYTEAIDARQIANAIPMSYRHLHNIFVEHVGRTIADELTRKRLEKAQHLLLTTSKKTMEVAWMAGFSSHERMSKVFRRILGTTPSAYRRSFRERPPIAKPLT